MLPLFPITIADDLNANAQATLLEGDTLEQLRTFPSSGIKLIITADWEKKTPVQTLPEEIISTSDAVIPVKPVLARTGLRGAKPGPKPKL